MYRKLSYSLLIILIFITNTFAQRENRNVISYYAVTNSLDGQPMIDMTNVLRFFPVYAMRLQIDTVKVTVYYGPNIYKKPAYKFDNGHYWEVLLPQFNLGEAIQRLEVEVHFNLDSIYSYKFSELSNLKNIADSNRRVIELSLQLKESQFRKQNENQLLQVEKNLEVEGIAYPQLRVLRKAKQDSDESFNTELNKLEKVLNQDRPLQDKMKSLKVTWGMIKDSVSYVNGIKLITRTGSLNRSRIESLIDSYLSLMDAHFTNYRDYKDSIQIILNEQSYIIEQEDSIRVRITKEIEIGLVDTSYSGPTVRESDVVVDNEYKGAKILYRNYKTSLRRMPALDPAERMGIFRVRYIPFPIVGTDENPRMNLKRPFAQGSPTVFEIGLAFGDAIVPGDEFVVPEFSAQRLGIAFAITQQLFSDSAQVIALALTYDFNSFGSIGIGGNFAGKGVHGYLSFGINKKAFETLIKVIGNIFQ
jgi:hypothetical protein